MRALLAALTIASLLGCLLAPAASQAQQAGGTRATEVTFESGRLTLRGFIYKPDGPDPLPVVLWNHGSEQRPGWLPVLGPLFMAALAFARSLPYVDSDRIAIAGCSFDGIQTLLAAERGHGARAAIAFAAAAQTWKHSYSLRDRLREAVRRAAMPIMLVQAQNDYDLEPRRSLVKEVDRLGKAPKLVIFPPFGSSAQDGHEFCVRGAHSWSAEVFSFLRGSMSR